MSTWRAVSLFHFVGLEGNSPEVQLCHLKKCVPQHVSSSLSNRFIVKGKTKRKKRKSPTPQGHKCHKLPDWTLANYDSGNKSCP